RPQARARPGLSGLLRAAGLPFQALRPLLVPGDGHLLPALSPAICARRRVYGHAALHLPGLRLLEYAAAGAHPGLARPGRQRAAAGPAGSRLVPKRALLLAGPVRAPQERVSRPYPRPAIFPA